MPIPDRVDAHPPKIDVNQPQRGLTAVGKEAVVLAEMHIRSDFRLKRDAVQ